MPLSYAVSAMQRVAGSPTIGATYARDVLIVAGCAAWPCPGGGNFALHPEAGSCRPGALVRSVRGAFLPEWCGISALLTHPWVCSGVVMGDTPFSHRFWAV